MPKFIGLKTKGDTESVIINVDSVNLLLVKNCTVVTNDGSVLELNENSTKFLLEILMENEYKLQGVEE